MNVTLDKLILTAGACQFFVLIASALVPVRLNWLHDFGSLSKLQRQMYWIYGGYVVLSIVAFGLISVTNASELASGTGLARAFCTYVAIFWGVRLSLQAVLDVRDHLNRWWLRWGYRTLTVLFAFFSGVYGYAAFLPR